MCVCVSVCVCVCVCVCVYVCVTLLHKQIILFLKCYVNYIIYHYYILAK